MLYSAKTNGFYDRAIHGENVPADAVEITKEQWQELLDGQSRGLVIVSNARGYPILREPPEEKLLVPERVTMRQARLALLAAGHYDKVQAAFANMPDDVKTAALIEWEYAGHVERNSRFTQQMAAILGLDNAGLDALFMAAAKI